MKIVHVVEPFSSGITTFIIYLVNGMPEHDNFVVHGTRVSSDAIENVKSKFNQSTKFYTWRNARRPINFWWDLKAAIELYKHLKKINPDVIHLHSSKAGFLGRVIGKFFNCKIIYTPNGLSFAREDIGVITKRLYIWMESIAEKICGQIICCSKSESDLMMKYGMCNSYINNGTDIPVSNDSPKTLGKVITIGCVALVTEQKDPESFNKIAEHFVSKEGVKFLWIGDGHLRSKLTSTNIEITGWLDKEEKLEHFEKLDIYLSTSLWEGLPFSVLEAMGYNKCLLLKNCIGNKDLVIDDYNGYVFNSVEGAIEKLDKLITNKIRISEFGKASYEMLKSNFNVEDMITHYCKAYNN